MMISKRLSLAIALSAAFLLPTGEAFAFTFTRIANSNDPFSSFTVPAINNAGIVTFQAELDAGGSGIFTGSGGATTTIANSSSTLSLFSTPAINNAGTVAFQANLDTGGSGIFTSNGGTTTTIITSNSTVGVPAINNTGTVAFSTGSGILTGSGGATTTIVDSSGPFLFFEEPAINDTNTVVFAATLDTGNRGIFTVQDGDDLTTIADTSGLYSFLVNPTINDTGTVAFQANLDGGDSGIFTFQNGDFTTVADTSGSFLFFEEPALNNAGTVAFKGVLETGEIGIFTGLDPVADQVIAVGDSLDGSTVTDLFLSTNGLNDAGQLAFYAELANGTSGIFRAEPTPIPEPSSGLGLLTAGVLGAALRLQRVCKLRGRECKDE